MRDYGNPNNHVSQRTELRRYPRRLTAAQSRRAKRMRDQGRTFDAIAQALGVDRDTLLASSGLWRDLDSLSGNAVLNVDPEDRDGFRQDYCLPGEAVRLAFKRHLEKHRQLLAWAKATGFPGLTLTAGLSLEMDAHGEEGHLPGPTQ